MIGETLGRDAELATARAFLASVPDGPSALLIEGEVGIGKTTLWRAALAEAAAGEVRVLSCVADQAEVRLSFVGLGDLLRDVVDHGRTSVIAVAVRATI
jgi:predicted ATPase